MTVADGGVGKSTLAIAEGVAIALGRNLLGVPVPGPLEVLYINLEEPADPRGLPALPHRTQRA